VYRPPQAPDTGDTAEVVDTDDSAGSDTASDEPTPDTGARDTAPDCGCASGKVPMGWMLVALAALGLRRRHYGQMSVSQNAMSSEG
jgi:MYXO-CTERM domain-containing protein